MLIKCFSHLECAEINADLLNFEKAFLYPAGDGQFYISHAPQYTHFFRHLRFNCEEPLFFIAYNQDKKIVGMVVAVLQEVPYENGYKKVWYLCDLKISKSVKSLQILLGLFKAVKERCYPICKNAYALSMNSGEAENTVLRFAKRNPFLSFEFGKILNIYDVSSSIKGAGVLDSQLYCSTQSKTIVMNGQHINLWHQVNSCHVINPNFKVSAQNGATDDTFVLSMKSFNNKVWGSCTAMHIGLKDMDWSWVSTCDI